MPRNRNGNGRNATRVVVSTTSGNQQAQNQSGRRRRRQTPVNVNITNQARPPGGPTRQQQQPQRQRQLRVWRNRRTPRSQTAFQHQICQKITTTLGTVGSNTSDSIETELTTILNPSLMKEQTGSNNYGPLNVLAAQYAMWKLEELRVQLKPLVGNNAAAGTVTRISYNPSTGAGQTSWSSLGARKHADVGIGKTGNFVLKSSDIKGPKSGWFLANTTNDANLSCGGVINIHSLGKTTNPYTNNPYQGQLFLCEVTTVWRFKDYLQQPGLINLIKGEETTPASIGTDTNGKIYMRVANGSRLAEASNTPGAAEIIWNITDTIISAGTSNFPPPFNWLFKGGWWFLKRLVNAPVNDNAIYFDVFPSFTDAQNNRYIYSSATSMSPVNVDSVTYQQVTPSNTGVSGDQFLARGITQVPRAKYTIRALKMMHNATDRDYIPATPMWFQKKNVTSSDRGILLNPGTNRVTTYDLFEADVEGPIPTSGIPVYFQDTTQTMAGYGVAYSNYSGTIAQDSTNKDIHLTSMLFYATTNRGYTFTQSNDGLFKEAHATYNAFARGLVVGSGDLTERRLQIEAGHWYVAQFLCVGSVHRTVTIDGMVIRVPNDAWTGTAVHYSVPTVTGFSHSGFPIAYGSSITMTEFSNVQSRGAPEIDFYEDAVEDVESDTCTQNMDHDDSLYFDEPPVEVLQVEPEVEGIYNLLLSNGTTERQARLAANQIKPCKKYENFVATYHDSLVDGLSPAQARAAALGAQPENY
nr:capsid protein [Water buffalo astrovirus]